MLDKKDLKTMIKMAAAYRDKSISDIATECFDVSPQALYDKIKDGRVRITDMERIAAMLDIDFSMRFHLPDGTEI